MNFYIRQGEKNEMKLYNDDDYCKVCFKKIMHKSFYDFMNKSVCLCEDCKSKISAKFHYFKVKGYKAMSIFDYDSELRKLIYQFKGCFDIELFDVFLERYRKELKLLYKNYMLVPAPSFSEEDRVRGFNHVVKIFSSMGLEINRCIEKTDRFKQAEHNSSSRSEISKHLKLVNGEILFNKKILIVDDVYTTGSTVKAMINMAEQFNPKDIRVLVICKTVLKPIDT